MIILKASGDHIGSFWGSYCYSAFGLAHEQFLKKKTKRIHSKVLEFILKTSMDHIGRRMDTGMGTGMDSGMGTGMPNREYRAI